MITDVELDAIEARADKATVGPWAFNDSDSEYWFAPIEAPNGALFSGEKFDRDDDGRFIASAREDVPALVDELRKARDLLRALDPRGCGDTNTCHDVECEAGRYLRQCGGKGDAA